MANKQFCQKLKKAREAAGLTQKDICNWLNIKQPRISGWETGISEPPISTFLQLCAKYEITDILGYFSSDSIDGRRRVLDSKMLNKLADLPERGRAAVYNCIDFEYSNMRIQQFSSHRRIPVYYQPAAVGLGNYMSDSDYEEMELDAPSDADAGIRISGDSMEPVIHDGEIAFVKFQPQILGDQVGIFILNGEAFCKRLEYRGRETYLCSFNPKYSPIHISVDDDLRTIGRVLL